MNRLLIIGCSQKKCDSPRTLSAIDRYDGPAFRVLRKYLREQPTEAPTVYILSAKYGLIHGEEIIPSYNCRLTTSSKQRILPQIQQCIKRIMPAKRWNQIGICAGRQYRLLLAEAGTMEAKSIQVIGGGQGKRLAALHSWLREKRRGIS